MTTVPLTAEAVPADFERAFDSLMQQIKGVQDRILADQAETQRLMADYHTSKPPAYSSRLDNKPLSARIEEILGSHAAKTA